ncbi:MAG: AgmX/PglI C-terminal domain-containing protein [Polyangiaceae bacterium]
MRETLGRLALCVYLAGCGGAPAQKPQPAPAPAPTATLGTAITPAPSGSAARPTRGRLDPAVIQATVRSSFPRFRSCYEEALGRDPSARGRVAMRFVIAVDGHVSSAKVQENTMTDARVAECLIPWFAALEFPPPQGGIVTVVYPLQFSPANHPPRAAPGTAPGPAGAPTSQPFASPPASPPAP